MKILLPIALALAGLGAGLGAGVALKPAEEASEPAAAPCPPPEEAPGTTPEPGDTAEDCAAAAPDPFAPVARDAPARTGALAIVALDKPFVAPVFRGEKVAALVVASIAIEIAAEAEAAVKTAQPRLRDAFLVVMFRHANSGGFDGAFTAGRQMDDLRSALLGAAREVFPGVGVNDVLITEIARQDN